MKALSIKQPWASLIAHGIKDIENRTWKTNFRGRIYIHASGLYAKGGFSLINSDQRVLANMYESWKPLYLDDLPTSAIIGEVDIIDCVINHPSIWAEKTEGVTVGNQFYYKKAIYNWVLANPILYKNPILNVKGKSFFWEPDIDLQQCIWCSGRSNYEEMIQDNAGEDYCPECWKEAEPILKAEYDMLVKNGEIDPND